MNAARCRARYDPLMVHRSQTPQVQVAASNWGQSRIRNMHHRATGVHAEVRRSPEIRRTPAAPAGKRSRHDGATALILTACPAPEVTTGFLVRMS
jgi:hypothetical protein